MSLDAVAEGPIGEDPVVVLATDLFPLNEAAGFQLSDDALHGTFGDPDLQCDFPEHDGRSPGEQNQDVAVVCQKRPWRLIRWNAELRRGDCSRRRCPYFAPF